jgi:hypothetical protein
MLHQELCKQHKHRKPKAATPVSNGKQRAKDCPNGILVEGVRQYGALLACEEAETDVCVMLLGLQIQNNE